MEHFCANPNRVHLRELDRSANAANFFLDFSVPALFEDEACEIIRKTAMQLAKHEKFTTIWAHKITIDHSNLNWAINRTDRVKRKSNESSSRSRSISPVKKPRPSYDDQLIESSTVELPEAPTKAARQDAIHPPSRSRSIHSKNPAVTEMCKTPTVTNSGNLERLWDFEDLYYLTCAKIRTYYDDLRLRLAHFDNFRDVVLHNRGYYCDADSSNNNEDPFTYYDMAYFLARKWTTLQNPSLMHTLDRWIRIKNGPAYPNTDPSEIPGLKNTNALHVGGVAALLWDKNEALLDAEKAAEDRWVAERRKQQQQRSSWGPTLPCCCEVDEGCPCRALCLAQPEEDCLCRACPAFVALDWVEGFGERGAGRNTMRIALTFMEGFEMEVGGEEGRRGKWWKRGWRKVKGWMGRRG
ncbi:MAG: hypothetical protein Q9165_003628 [Trypethelium subeluteriae]